MLQNPTPKAFGASYIGAQLYLAAGTLDRFCRFYEDQVHVAGFEPPIFGIGAEREAFATADTSLEEFHRLPDLLKGCDWIQTANADKLYNAADLIELAPGEDSVIYVAHDDRLPRPAWLQRLFTPTEISLAVDGKTMKLFERRVRSGESLTLGSNTEDRRLKSCNMYLVFVKPAEPVKRAGS